MFMSTSPETEAAANAATQVMELIVYTSRITAFGDSHKPAACDSAVSTDRGLSSVLKKTRERLEASPKTCVGCSENSMGFQASCFRLHGFFGIG